MREELTGREPFDKLKAFPGTYRKGADQEIGDPRVENLKP